MMKLSPVLLVVSVVGLFAAEGPRREFMRNRTNEPPPAVKGEAKKEEAKPPAATIPDATHKPVLTTNTVSIAGQSVTYVAEAGMLPLLKPDGSVRASVFYVAYTREVDSNAPPRPVTFCFNGGPGSSSVWLHLGALGPRRVKMNDDGTLPKQPFGLVDNDYSILHVTDLVFIDPVATGFSRPAKDEKPEDFFGQSADVESVGDFIRLWTSRHERWLSSKFLCGESYGVFRAAGLADYLHSRYGMYLSGLIFVSGVLDFATLGGGPGNDLSYLIFLPAYTSIAHYHKRLPPDLQADLAKARAEAHEFVRAEYPAALLRGAALPPAERSNIVAKLTRLTGLPSSVIEENDLRVDASVFRKMLLHDQGLILGRYDARITGRDGNPASRVPRFDPSDAAAYGPFAAAMNSYLRQELKFEDDLPYELLARVGPWNFDARNSSPSVSGRLASVMSQNPHLRVLVLGSLCDLACPIDSLHYSVEHMQLDPAYRGNITYTEYSSGHMMYLNLPDLKKMQRDLEGFLRQ
jgi:carboxypeptidase C (cathepsin A)